MPRMIARYTSGERATHWIVAVFFILAALSGLAFFHPSYFFLTNLFGGGPWTRILHPFIGLVMFFAFMAFALRLWDVNKLTDNDRLWMKRIGDVAANRDHDLPEVGKYNAGQKYLFWLLLLCMLALVVTGFLMWRPWFAGYVPIWLNRTAVVVHALAGFGLILLIILHIYAAIWTKGSIRAMTRGTVSEAWAKHHHPAWHREVSGK